MSLPPAQEVKEDVYCHEVAKRSVSRAALHLGLDSMSEEALDVLGDVLLTYLQRIGKTISSAVESSGRTSAHVNVLDAIEAVSQCTPPAVHQLHPQDDEGEQDGSSAAAAATISTNGTVWQDLAQFVFGKDWHLPLQDRRDEAVRLGTGKEGPSASTKKKRGWEAPYLEEVPPFPLATTQCANPHSLPASVARSLHPQQHPAENEQVDVQEVERELAEIPDHVFTAEWGIVDNAQEDEKDAKAKKADTEKKEASEKEPPSKRRKADNDDKAKASTAPAAATMDDRTKRPAYVPSFLPPFPSANSLGRIVMDVEEDTLHKTSVTAPASSEVVPSGSATGAFQVRSSLVKLGQNVNYWGSGWDAPPSAKKALQVPLGRKTSGGAAPPAVVVPIKRPSGSRVGRILEGSMDAAS